MQDKIKTNERLQGTDGVRKVTSLTREFSKCTDPLKTFYQEDIITEEFVELYSYSFVISLKKRGFFKKNRLIVIGWDPRDKQGVFTEMAVQGVRKAGADAVVLGITPTPMVSIYINYINASGGIMLTASHNPYDQNGIKVFWGDMAIKSLPEDDIYLTNTVCSQDYSEVKAKKLSGERLKHENAGWKLFDSFHIDPVNSWLKKEGFKGNYILFLDCANGSYSTRLESLFRKSGFEEVHEVNNSLDEYVNHRCGVAFFEGKKEVTAREYEENPDFSQNGIINALFKKGRERKEDILNTKIWVSGITFDADGDRFYRLDYDPYLDRVIIISGDESLLHQCRYQKVKQGKKGIFVNTIESDINMLTAVRKMNIDPYLTVVGDKWILSKAIITLIKEYASICMKYRANNSELLNLRREIERVEAGDNINAAEITKWKTIIDSLSRNQKINSEIEELDKGCKDSGFIAGGEESGHSITAGRLKDINGKYRTVFLGNGVKGAINTFAAIDDYIFSIKSNKKLDFIQRPFIEGVKKGFYIYYIDKSKLTGDALFFKEFTKVLIGLCKEEFGAINVKSINFSEDNNLIYIGLFEKDNVQVGGIFSRNSGTEDKASVNIRGDKRYCQGLLAVAEKACYYLIKNIKNRANIYARASESVLTNLNSTTVKKEEIECPKGVVKDRLFAEMKKEGFISEGKEGIIITDKGEWYLKYIKETYGNRKVF